MTEEKLVERVTALFADSDAAQRKMIRLYAETNDAIEASAIIDSGAEVLHMLQGGLRPEVLVLDSVLSDTTIFPLLRSIRQQQIEYEPHIIVTLMPSAAPQIEKILTLGAECTIFKPYSLPELFDTVYQTAASGPRLYKSNTPAYQMLCERNGKTPQDRLTVSELLEAVIARTHHDLRC